MVKNKKMPNGLKIISALLVLFGVIMLLFDIYAVFDDQMLNRSHPDIFSFIFTSIITIFFVGLSFITAYGFFNLKKWAKKSFFILLITFIIFLIIFSTFQTVFILMSLILLVIILILYLNQEIIEIYN